MKLVTNLITTSRVFLTIILMCLYKSIPNIYFLIFIALIYATDFIDGKLARGFHVETFYGSLMDTIADKVLNIALLLPLLSVSKWFYLLLGLEITILLVNTIGTIHGKKTRSLFLGKVKMWFIFLTIIFGYACIFNYLNRKYAFVALNLTIILEVFVTIDYIIFLVKQKKKPKRFKIKSMSDLKYFLFDTEYYKSTLTKIS